MAVVPRAVRRYAVRTIRFRATRQGLLGGHKGWLVVFGLLQLSRHVGQITKRGQAPVLFSERLLPGERLEIVHLPEPPRRRRARRAR